MNNRYEKDEYLEQLWGMKENNITSIEELKNNPHIEYNTQIIQELIEEKIIKADFDKNTVVLTETGKKKARHIMRAHRLAERLFYDVLGCELESGACEFEHTVTPELVNSICILLGHPKECPHGMPIPKGDCCIKSTDTAKSSVVSLSKLKTSESARVAYVNSQNDQQLHRMDGLHIRPGATVTMHQRYPSFVIECEGANIAMDEVIVSNIYVWKKAEHLLATNEVKGKTEDRGNGGFGFMRRKKNREYQQF